MLKDRKFRVLVQKPRLAPHAELVDRNSPDSPECASYRRLGLPEHARNILLRSSRPECMNPPCSVDRVERRKI
jgi:hypothetical protein